MTYLPNLLSEKEEIPKIWELADIISIYKGKGNKTDINNQRGISLASCMLKCLERVIWRK